MLTWEGMRAFPLLTQKGGSGKSTLSVQLAFAAAELGYRVAVVDVDPQRSTTTWFRRYPDAKDCPFDLVSVREDQIESTHAEAARLGYDLLIYDTPGMDATSSRRVVDLCEVVIVPSKTELFDLFGQQTTADMLRRFDDPNAYFLLNDCPRNSKRAKAALTHLEGYGLPICPHKISHYLAVPDSISWFEGVTQWAPESKAAAELTTLLGWILEQLTRTEARAA